MDSPTLTLFSSVANSRVDAAAGIIRGVSLITEGPALGHGVLIDSTTLKQVKASVETYDGGLKVKLDHEGGAGDIIGWIDGFRIAGKKLLGDLHLLQTSEHRGYVLEIAEKIPDTFGLSLAFSGGTEAGADKQLLQRCTEVYSCDLVSEPAANKGGLFSRKQNTNMEDPNKKPADPVAEALSQFAARLAKLEAFAFPPAAEEKKEEPAAMAAVKPEDAVMLALKEFAAKFGTPAATISPAAPVAPAKPEVKTFEALVAARRVEFKGDNAAAITSVISSHPTEYAAYRARFGQGEVIKL
jgi:hypothetical protein